MSIPSKGSALYLHIHCIHSIVLYIILIELSNCVYFTTTSAQNKIFYLDSQSYHKYLIPIF